MTVGVGRAGGASGASVKRIGLQSNPTGCFSKELNGSIIRDDAERSQCQPAAAAEEEGQQLQQQCAMQASPGSKEGHQEPPRQGPGRAGRSCPKVHTGHARSCNCIARIIITATL